MLAYALAVIPTLWLGRLWWKRRHAPRATAAAAHAHQRGVSAAVTAPAAWRPARPQHRLDHGVRDAGRAQASGSPGSSTSTPGARPRPSRAAPRRSLPSASPRGSRHRAGRSAGGGGPVYGWSGTIAAGRGFGATATPFRYPPGASRHRRPAGPAWPSAACVKWIRSCPFGMWTYSPLDLDPVADRERRRPRPRRRDRARRFTRPVVSSARCVSAPGGWLAAGLALERVISNSRNFRPFLCIVSPRRGATVPSPTISTNGLFLRREAGARSGRPPGRRAVTRTSGRGFAAGHYRGSSCIPPH